MAMSSTELITALCAFNANQDSIFSVTERELSRLLNNSEFRALLRSGKQGEVIVRKRLYEEIRSSCKHLTNRLALGGNAGIMANELSSDFLCHIACPYKVKLGSNLFSNPLNIRINTKRLRNEVCCDPFAHLVFETEKRRVIITPKQKFRVTPDMRRLAVKKFDLAVFSGMHLLSFKELEQFIDYALGIRAGFKFIELGSFSSIQCMNLVSESLLPHVGMVGLSKEEELQFGRSVLSRRAKSFVVHSKGALRFYPSSLKPAVLKVAKKTDSLFRNSGISVGLGDRFSALLLKEVLAH